MGCSDFNMKKKISSSVTACSVVAHMSNSHKQCSSGIMDISETLKFICAWEGLVCPFVWKGKENLQNRVQSEGNCALNCQKGVGQSWRKYLTVTRPKAITQGRGFCRQNWTHVIRCSQSQRTFSFIWEKVCCNNTLMRTMFLCLISLFNVLYPDLLGAVK